MPNLSRIIPANGREKIRNDLATEGTENPGISSGRVWGLWQDEQGNWEQTLLLAHNLTVSSFGRDTAGELYLVDYGNGTILRFRSSL